MLGVREKEGEEGERRGRGGVEEGGRGGEVGERRGRGGGEVEEGARRGEEGIQMY
jgi:hypothetical protein